MQLITDIVDPFVVALVIFVPATLLHQRLDDGCCNEMLYLESFFASQVFVGDQRMVRIGAFMGLAKDVLE